MLNLLTSLLDIRGVGARFFPKLKKLGIYTVGDLLWHFPARYEDYSKIYKISDLEPEQFATIQGIIEDIDVRHSWRRGFVITEATIADDSGTIRAVWFNQPYIQSSLPRGRVVNVSGKISFSEESELYFNNPSVEAVREGETKHTARIVPIYPETRGLTSKGLRFLVQTILKNIRLEEWIPKDMLSTHRLPDIHQAIQSIHFPKTLDDAFIAKNRFAFEDLFLLQLVHFKERAALAKEHGFPLSTDIEWLKSILTALPFKLTESQKRSLWDVIKDIGKPTPMNRLLQGDVGSGKTVIAALTALIAAKNGYQTAFMAPTEVLARQHFETIKKLFRNIGAEHQATLGLLTGSTAKIFYESDLEADTTRASFMDKLAQNDIKIAIGTHALIEETVTFGKLGFVVIDEQHRFGVRQRAELLRGSRQTVPHFLSMSATPIPRTLMLTVFGDLDISIIDELPAGRKQILTKIIPPSERQKIYAFIREQIHEGRQVFVICPRIEAQSEEQAIDSKLQNAIEVKSVKEEHEKLSKIVFPDLRVGMLHGQMPAKSKSPETPSKTQVMQDFMDRKLDILVSTSVIEVGVDVPNASIMMIEGSERFGLAQLYQFRGRVGRGEHQSYCFLCTDSESQNTRTRLKAILTAKNGFELAEYDLKLRGPGQFLGTEQTGIPDIAMENLQNMELVSASREAATKLITQDPTLTHHKLVKEKLKEFKKKIHRE